MDKFGIFNLLNSFFNFNSENNENNLSSSDLKKDDKKDDFSVDSFISAIKDNGFATKKEDVPINFTPLQNNMISTMKSHDEFIRRVKEKNHK